MDKEFPTLEDVHVVLSDLTGLFEDRNAMLHTMMKEDKYKDFLLAENIQSMVEADNRDDSRSGGIRTDLANGYEILRAQTTMRKFANFINPASLPIMDLGAPIEFYDDYEDEDEEEVVEEIEKTKEEKTDGSNGKPGTDGEDGNTNLNISAPKDTSKNITPNNQPDTKLAKGAYVNPANSPLKNSLQTDYKPAKDHGSIKSLEDLGLDGDTNVASEFTEDLGLDKYKAALGNAMGLPLKAVAAGLSGLLSALSMPNTPEFAAAKEQISSISESFDLPKPNMSSEGDTNINNQNNKEQLIAGGGIFSTLTNMFGLAKNKDHQVSPETPMGAAVTGLQNRRQQNEKLIQMLEGGVGGPSLDGSPPDKIYASANTHYDQTQTAITNVAESAKSIFKSSTSSSTTNSTSNILNQILGGVYKADIGAQTNNQDINSLTNQVIELNEVSVSENNTLMISGSEDQNYESQLAAKVRAIQGSVNLGSGITMDMKNSVAPTELEVSRFLLANIGTVHGGETSHDVV